MMMHFKDRNKERNRRRKRKRKERDGSNKRTSEQGERSNNDRVFSSSFHNNAVAAQITYQVLFALVPITATLK